MRELLFISAILLTFYGQIQAQNLSKQAKAVEAVEKSGGKVEYDSNKRVVKVDLHDTKITDADLKNLEAFGELQWLDLRITAIGDEGVGHLKKLKKLTFLI
jgi:hypothetical protein